jgi:hypothetical protein
MNIITFVRQNKTTPVGTLLPIIQTYDKTINTKSIHLGLVALFSNHYQNLNNRRLYEFMRWINKKFTELPSTNNVEANLSKIRQIVKRKWGYDSVEYRKSQVHLVFDPAQKHINIAEYNKKVFERNENCRPIKVSLINKLLTYKTSTDYKKQIVYLLLNSGARYHELFTGVWSLDPNNTHNIILSNISKTRDKTREISKPLLDRSPEHFLSILNQIKNMNEDSTHSMVNTFLNKEIQQSTYFLRKAYANFAYYLLDDPTVAKTTYLSKILGHEPNTESTATCYQGYYIDLDTDFKLG